MQPGTQLGRYTTVERIARGGMAEVYLAVATGIEGFEKLIALKVPHPHLAENPDFIRMFLNEARIAASLHHPNVCEVFDLGDDDGLYMAMEYLNGETLRAILRKLAGRRLPVGVAIGIVQSVCAGLHYVHEASDAQGAPRGLVHRDISPSNIMLTYEGGVKIVDFGIAKAADITSATRTGTLRGKVPYMSPEQVACDRLDRRSDVFSLGVVLYEATTGRRMFWGHNDLTIMNRVAEGQYVPPHEIVPAYPRELAAILERAVAVDPDRRYRTAQDLALDLEDFARERRLKTELGALRAFMQQEFEPRPEPVIPPALRTIVTDKALPPVVATAPMAMVPTARQQWRRQLAMSVGLLGLGGLIGVAAASRTDAGEETVTVPGPPSPSGVSAVGAAPAEPPPTKTELPTPPDAAPEADLEAVPEAEGSTGAASVPSSPAPRKDRRKSKGRKKAGANKRRASRAREASRSSEPDPMRPL